MASVGDLEVFIPEYSRVITLPVRSLPSSIIRKMAACPGDSEQPAAFISPVELREKGATPRPRPLAPGQIHLPVVTSNPRAFRTLQNFLHSGEISLQFSAENLRSSFSRKKNSIILFKSNIFLIEPKARMPDWLRQKRSSAPLECKAPPPNTPVKTQNDDITERRRSKDGAGASEDHGKCGAVLQEREADAMKEREEEKQEALIKDASTNTPKIKLERGVRAVASSQPERANEMTSTSSDQISSQSSAVKANCHKRLVFPARQNSPETNANQTPDKNEVKGQISDSEIEHANADDGENAKGGVGVQSRGGQSAVEIIDVTDDNSEQENADMAHVSRVESLLKTCERIQRRINKCVTSMGSVGERKRHDVAMETNTGHDDLIIVDEPDRHVSGDKPIAGGRILLSRADSRACPSTPRERCESIIEIVDDVIIEDGEVVYSRGHQNGDVANGIKRKNKTKISEVGGAKQKRLDNVAPNFQVQKDVRIIDDDDDETTVQMDEGSGGGEASGRELDGEISELPEPQRVSRSNGSEETKADAEAGGEVQRVNAEDASAQRNRQEQEDVLMKVPSGSSEAESSWTESEVRVVKLHPDDPVLREGSQGPNGDDANGCAESDVSEVLRAAEGVGPAAAPEHHEFAAQRSGATNQSARREDANVLPHPTCPPANHETVYVVLRREENINRMREKLRRMEEKLNALKNAKH